MSSDPTDCRLVAYEEAIFPKPHDLITIEIEGLGRLRNRVSA